MFAELEGCFQLYGRGSFLSVIDKRKLRDPHPDADEWLAALPKARAALTVGYERKLRKRVRRLGQEAIDRRRRRTLATAVWRKRHPEKARALQKRINVKRVDKQAEYGKQWRSKAANREKHAKRMREFRARGKVS